VRPPVPQNLCAAPGAPEFLNQSATPRGSCVRVSLSEQRLLDLVSVLAHTLATVTPYLASGTIDPAVLARPLLTV
jgi:hypothetical protein